MNLSLLIKTPSALADWVDGAIELLLGALLATMPFALGVIAPWSEAIVVGAVASIALLLTARAWLAPDRQQALAWAFTPVMVFIVLAAAQLLPLPATVVGVVSPHTLAIKARLLGDLPGAAGLLGRITISFYPAATSHDLRLVLVCAVVFFATIQVLRREQQLVRMLWAVTLSGGAVAILALLQDLSGSGNIYWLFDSGHAVATGGPFVSYSNYSQYINLCTGAALALLLYTLRRDDILKSEGTRTSHRPHAGWHMRELLSWRAWPLMAVAALCCVTLCLSMSRGGVLSLLCATGLTVLMLARRRGMHGAAWLLALAALAAFGCLLYFGFDVVCDRLATLKTARDPSAGRIQTFKDILVEWRKFPLLGTGLGTHEYVYPMFDHSSDPALAEYADSDYFQVLEEMGAVGLALVLSFAGYVWVCYARAIRRGRPRMNVIAYGLGFGLLAVMFQSMTDFGQHLPAIGSISAAFCGMLVNLSRSQRRGKTAEAAATVSGASAGSGTSVARRAPRWAGLIVPAAFAAAMVWAVGGVASVWTSQAAADRAQAIADRLEGTAWKGTDADFAQLFDETAHAVAANPADVKARYALACYRWRVAMRGVDGDQPKNAVTDVLPATGPSGADAQRVIDELNAARIVCPTFGPVYAVAGQVERLVLNQPIGSAHVRTAFELAPAHPEVCLAAAQLDAVEGKFDDSLRKTRRCLELDSSFLSQVTDFYMHDVDRPDLAVAAAGDEPELLFRVYDDLREEDDGTDRPNVEAAMAAARATLKLTCDRPNAPAWTLSALGAILREDKDYPRAIALYQRALNKEYSQTDWRMSLAGVLAEAGQSAEALHQAEICLHLQPGMQAARKLIDDLNARPTIIEAPALSLSKGRGSASLETRPPD